MEERGVGLSKEDQLDRKLNYQFHNLSYPARLRIGLDLGLVFNSDEGLSRADLVRAWLGRAKERNILPLLSWHLARATVFDKIEKALWLCPDGGEALTEMLKTIQESREYKEWKPEKLERIEDTK